MTSVPISVILWRNEVALCVAACLRPPWTFRKAGGEVLVRRHARFRKNDFTRLNSYPYLCLALLQSDRLLSDGKVEVYLVSCIAYVPSSPRSTRGLQRLQRHGHARIRPDPADHLPHAFLCSTMWGASFSTRALLATCA